MGIALYFSFVPLPPYPLRGYLWGFLGLVVAGLVVYALLHVFAPSKVARIGTTEEDLTADAAGAAMQPELPPV
jgi:hypothetical protein